MELILAVIGGIGLAAACGFRVFVPPFITSLAACGYLGDAAQTPFVDAAHLEWLGSPTVAVALGVATAVEVGSFYIPYIDNILDTLAIPAAVAAGGLLSASVLPESADGGWSWILSGIAGGGAAGGVQGTTALVRGASVLTTGGLGNPIVSTIELVCAVVASILAVIVPIIAAFMLGVGLTLFFVWWRRRAARLAPARPAA